VDSVEKSGVVIRDATTGDIEYIVDFNYRLAVESENKILDRGVLTEGVHRGFGRPELCRYFVAEVDGNPAGMTMVTYELTDWQDGVIWWLQSVYVYPQYRRHGVFRTIFRHVEKLAQSDPDARALNLYVKSDNDRALKTYQAMGMVDGKYEVLEYELPDTATREP
jgi:ribosomal protein S18 acetylase RimI-like enzyme